MNVQGPSPSHRFSGIGTGRGSWTLTNVPRGLQGKTWIQEIPGVSELEVALVVADLHVRPDAFELARVAELELEPVGGLLLFQRRLPGERHQHCGDLLDP